MRSLRSLLFSMAMVTGLCVHHAQAASTRVNARFDYGSIFSEELYLSATHMFTETIGILTMFATYPGVKTLEVDVGPVFSLGAFTIAPGIGITFGPTSWTFSTDKSLRLGRDIAPYLALYYYSDLIEAESVSEFYFPLQESSATAVEFGVMKLWGAIKWKNWGIGPFIQPFFTRSSGQSLELSHLPFGAVMLANFEKVSLKLFLGHDPISLTNWLGFPKNTGPFYKAMATYNF